MVTSNRAPEDFYSDRVRHTAPSPTLAISDGARKLKAQGVDVVDLAGGDPDFITPEHIRRAAADAMNAGDTHYVSSSGTPALRKAIAKKLQQDNGITVDADTGIQVTPGGKAALFEAFMSFVEPGVDVLQLDPAWVSYEPMVGLAGGNVIHVPLDINTNYAITPELLESHVTPNTRVLILNTPNNPTGRVATREELQAIADAAMKHDFLVFSDEMYEKILYDGHEHISIAALPGMAERTLTFNGFSKAYAMTGWRLGYVAGPAAFIKKIATTHSHMCTCATSFVMAGGVAAYDGPQDTIGEMVRAWDRRRTLVTDGFNGIKGFHVNPIEGAFYAFVDGRGTGLPTAELADKILKEANVAVVPGDAFGETGESNFRISFATSDEALETALSRIRTVFGTTN